MCGGLFDNAASDACILFTQMGNKDNKWSNLREFGRMKMNQLKAILAFV